MVHCARLVLLLFSIGLMSCAGQKPPTEKIDGISFVAARDSINTDHVQPVVDLGANYAAIMPFGFIRDLSNPEIRFNTERQWFGEQREGVRQYIETLKKRDIKIMMKPQIWIWHGEFTGHLQMDSEEDWQKLEKSYTDFIMLYAELAEETDTELLCIGTELENFIKERPSYWSDLIAEIKKVYTGKLTYAANWDEYKRTPFWHQLDYIGIDAYFPVSEASTPSVEDCIEGWQVHKKEMQSRALKMDKPIVFTEFGYRNVDFTAKEPWKADRDMTSNNFEAQSNATKALFEVFWEEEWFAGGFIWKWFHNHDEVGGMDSNQFTPQNKPVEEIIRAYYRK